MGVMYKTTQIIHCCWKKSTTILHGGVIVLVLVQHDSAAPAALMMEDHDHDVVTIHQQQLHLDPDRRAPNIFMSQVTQNESYTNK